jgi:hypothetical protein
LAFFFVEYFLARAAISQGSAVGRNIENAAGIGVALVLMMYYRFLIVPKKSVETSSGMRYSISAGGVEIVTPSSHSFTQWSMYTRWLATPRAWMLVTPQGSSHVICRNDLDPNTATNIEALFTSQLPRGKTVRGNAVRLNATCRALLWLTGVVALLIYVPNTWNAEQELRRSWMYARDAFCQSRSWSELVRGPIAGTSACTRENVTLIGGKWNPALPVNNQQVQVAPLDAAVQVLTLQENPGVHAFFDDVTQISPTPAVVQLMDNLPVLITTKYPGPYNGLLEYPLDEIPNSFEPGAIAGWVAIVAFFCLFTTPRRKAQRHVATVTGAALSATP